MNLRLKETVEKVVWKRLKRIRELSAQVCCNRKHIRSLEKKSAINGKQIETLKQRANKAKELIEFIRKTRETKNGE